MNPALIGTILTGIQSLIGLAGPSLTSGTIGQVISILSGLIPAAIKEEQDVAPIVKNIIGSLSGHAAVTPEQRAELRQLDADSDALFDAAAARIPDDDDGDAAP